MPLDASFKPKKGGAKENVHSDLTHILGYTGLDVEAGPPSPDGSEKEQAGTGQCHALSTAGSRLGHKPRQPGLVCFWRVQGYEQELQRLCC